MTDVPMEIGPADLKARLGAVQVLECRESWEVEIVKLAGALDIPMNEVPMRAGELDAKRPVVVLCHHGGRSLAVARWLRANGHPDAQSLAGGIDLWAAEIDPSLARY